MVKMTISFTKLDFSFSVHSTENFDKNMIAIANLIPDEIIKDTKITVEELEGGYDNPIQYVFIEIRKPNEIEKITVSGAKLTYTKSMGFGLNQEQEEKTLQSIG